MILEIYPLRDDSFSNADEHRVMDCYDGSIHTTSQEPRAIEVRHAVCRLSWE